jgi:hypothetical protein
MRRLLIIVLTAVRAAMSGAAAALDRIARMFGGGGPTPPPPVPLTPEDVRGEVLDAYEREAAADEARASDIGLAVHQYASADDPGIRCAVDLAGLSRPQMDWLLGLTDEHLRKLASAGPRACELAVSGRRSGIIGLPVPAVENAAYEIEGPNPVRDLLSGRIRASRSRRTAALA